MRAMLVLLGLSVLLVGCAGGSGKPVKVEGTITLDGKPLPNAMVQFVPAEGTGRNASGVTGNDGEFRLTTFSTGDGAIAGTYKVVVTVPQAADSGGGKVAAGGDPKDVMKAMKGYAEKHKRAATLDTSKKGAVPKNYTSAETTPLKQVVPADGPVKLELRSSGS